MSIDINGYSIVDVLDANNIFNHGQTNIYQVTCIKESDVKVIEKISLFSFTDVWYPNKPEFEKADNDQYMNSNEDLNPNIYNKKDKLLKQLDIMESNNGIIGYKKFIDDHFDNIINHVKTHYNNLFAGEEIDFVKENKIKLNFFGIYILALKYNLIIENNRESRSNNCEIDVKQKILYEFLIEQYLLRYKLYLIEVELRDYGIIKKHLTKLSHDILYSDKGNLTKIPEFCKSVTPAVLFVLIKNIKSMSYEKALTETKNFFKPESLAHERYPFDRPLKSTLKRWVREKRKFLPKYNSMTVPQMVKHLSESDIFSWFKNLARNNDDYIDLLDITGIPQKTTSENENLRKQIYNLETHELQLSSIINNNHKLYILADNINWVLVHQSVLKKYYKNSEKFNHNGTRQLLGFFYLKNECNLEYDKAKEHWLENPYWQYFCGAKTFQHRFPVIFLNIDIKFFDDLPIKNIFISAQFNNPVTIE